jgi:hypothetical protein
VCDRFATREDNRRWCVEAIHRLLHEANRLDPSPSFRFVATDDAVSSGGAGIVDQKVASPFLM